MTPLELHAISLVALAAGVGIFVGPAGGYGAAPSPRSLAGYSLFALAAWAGAYGLTLDDHPFWAFALAAIGAGFATASWRDALRDRAGIWVRRGAWLAALAASVALFHFPDQEAERLAGEQAAARARQAQLAQELRALRKPWSADPDQGVAELASGRMKVWLAATPRVEIDAEYEDELGADAQREIPIRIVFLNDSFQSVTTEAAPGLTPVSWTVEVRDGDGASLRSWEVAENTPRPLQPAERRDYELAWDGRDDDGDLVPAGDYTIALSVVTPSGSAEQTLPVAIVDAGPIEIVEVDATTQYIREQEQMMRWNQTLQDGMRFIQQMQMQQMQMRNLGR